MGVLSCIVPVGSVAMPFVVADPFAGASVEDNLVVWHLDIDRSIDMSGSVDDAPVLSDGCAVTLKAADVMRPVFTVLSAQVAHATQHAVWARVAELAAVRPVGMHRLTGCLTA